MLPANLFPLTTKGLLLAVAFAVTSSPLRAGEGFQVIVNVSGGPAAISRRELSTLFLGRRAAWPDGSRSLPVDQGESSRTREAFSHAVHGRSAAAVRSYWLQILFAGRGVPPPERASDAEVLAYVRANPGAVGYVSEAGSTQGVRVLAVEP